jgi:hypothetical protein
LKIDAPWIVRGLTITPIFSKETGFRSLARQKVSAHAQFFIAMVLI